ncbi:hypothetical protein ANANG_G00210050 [Anguilla anguilla]|uniref:Elongator complex protein 4 n=1 Tax=Anguilla anguilla TaxID=7936 RepID=A0A9D3M192_ANGAN|nr:hypothetical protein ANANG_G00210050 [Anguilla anguilla]
MAAPSNSMSSSGPEQKARLACNTTSFQKKSRSNFISIPGTRPSVQNGQLIVSTGVTSLDYVIGGGLAVGTLLLIEEDKYDSYSRMLVKYFLAEGVVCGHSLFIGSARDHPDEILQELPAPILDDIASPRSEEGQGTCDPEAPDSMKIAWRYQNLPKVQTALASSSRFGHYYDVSKTMDPEMRQTAKCTSFFLPQEVALGSAAEPSQMIEGYRALLRSIQGAIRSQGFDGSTPSLPPPPAAPGALDAFLRFSFRGSGESLAPPTRGVLAPSRDATARRSLLARTRLAALRVSTEPALKTPPGPACQNKSAPLLLWRRQTFRKKASPDGSSSASLWTCPRRLHGPTGRGPGSGGDRRHSPAGFSTELTQKLERPRKDVRKKRPGCQGAPLSDAAAKSRNVLRIGLRSLGSALWGDDVCCSESPAHAAALATFLYGLRALLRCSLSVAMVTVPAHLVQNRAIMDRVTRLCDTAVALESFRGLEREANPLYKDYHGLLHVKQTPHLNCLVCEVPDQKDLAFKLKRKQFTIEVRLSDDTPHAMRRTPPAEGLSRSDAASGRAFAPKKNAQPAKRVCRPSGPPRGTPPILVRISVNPAPHSLTSVSVQR